MTVDEQIERYLASQPEAKRRDLEALHHRILNALPSTSRESA